MTADCCGKVSITCEFVCGDLLSMHFGLSLMGGSTEVYNHSEFLGMSEMHPVSKTIYQTILKTADM